MVRRVVAANLPGHNPQTRTTGQPTENPMLSLSRREFLRRSAILTSAAAASTLLRQTQAMQAAAKPLDIVILGAGLSGLVCAYELEQRGHHITLLEADQRHIGGRARTVRFADGLYGEAGAMRIPTKHDVTRHYIKLFGLTLRKFVQSNDQGYFFARNQKVRIKDALQLQSAYNLNADEKGKTSDDLWAKAVTNRLKPFTPAEKEDLLSPVFRTDTLRKFDQLSLRQVCEQAGLSQEALEYLMITQGQEQELETGIDETIREEYKELWSLDFDEIVGGTDRLPAAFADHLRNRPRMGCEVIKVTQSGDKPSAIYLENGQERKIEGDYLICTLPCPILTRIDLEGISPAKMRAIRELTYDSACKILAVCNHRFWETTDGIFGGGTFTDLPTGTTYYPADNAQAKDPATSKGPGVMLASYTWGHQARRLGALGEQDRSAIVPHHLGKVHPELRDKEILRQQASWSWDQHRWSGGAFAWFSPGQHTDLYPDLLKPEGKIYFAGEHASLSHTWMQGALESGLRVVSEITKRGR
jgi:monoamine oxidase